MGLLQLRNELTRIKVGFVIHLHFWNGTDIHLVEDPVFKVSAFHFYTVHGELSASEAVKIECIFSILLLSVKLIIFSTRKIWKYSHRIIKGVEIRHRFSASWFVCFAHFFLKEFEQSQLYSLVNAINGNGVVNLFSELLCLHLNLHVLVFHLLINLYHILFDMVNIINSLLSRITWDITKYFDDLHKLYFQLLNLSLQLFVFFFKAWFSIFKWLAELVNKLINHIDVFRSDPHQALSDIFLPVSDNINVFHVSFNSFLGHYFDIFELVHLAFVTLVDVKKLFWAYETFEAHIPIFLLREESCWRLMLVTQHFNRAIKNRSFTVFREYIFFILRLFGNCWLVANVLRNIKLIIYDHSPQIIFVWHIFFEVILFSLHLHNLVGISLAVWVFSHEVIYINFDLFGYSWFILENFTEFFGCKVFHFSHSFFRVRF